MAGKKKSTQKWLILMLLAGGGWAVYHYGLPRLQFKAFSGHLESVVNEALSQAGIDDSRILEQTHRERRQWGVSWIETDRRIKVANENELNVVSRAIEEVAQNNNCEFSRDSEGLDHVRIKVTRGWAIFQNILFVVAPEESMVSMPPPHTVPKPVVNPLQNSVVAFVIDDVAYDLKPIDHFMSLKIPLTFAILPREKHSRQLAEKAVRLGYPVILHLPMQPIDLAHNNPGPSGLYLNMTSTQLHEQFEKDVASIPHLQGINNHMGSAFTSSESEMSLVMPWVKEKHLFFLDSHTTPHSVVSRVAQRVGVPCLINDTFLDNEDSVAAIEHQLDIVLKLALKNKRTIAIGHYRRKHLVEAFAHKIPEFEAKGVKLVYLPSLYSHP